MKYLNLDKNFNPYKAEDSECINFESFFFSGGEPHIKIERNWDFGESLVISTRINRSDDLFILILACDAIQRIGDYRTLHLIVPYFPGARQDRVMVEGEPLTARIYADLINDLQFTSVQILDPHSDVLTALINNVIVINNHEFVSKCINDIKSNSYSIISPDAGSNKKMKDLMKYLSDKGHVTELVKCDKTRDIKTGSITGFEVYQDSLHGDDCIIVDDICANGGTFMGLAEELKKKGAGKLYLIITHGEFGSSKPITFERLSKIFDCVYCTDSIFNMDEAFYESYRHYNHLRLKEKFKQIKIEDLYEDIVR